jgi:histone H3/H4
MIIMMLPSDIQSRDLIPTISLTHLQFNVLALLLLSPSPYRSEAEERMQPPHLSCPSSSTSAYASSYVTPVIQSILHSAGFSKTSSQAVQLLTEVFERYLLLLASTSKHHCNHVGRRLATSCDVERSLMDLGSSVEDVQRWFEEEGGDVAGNWLDGSQDDAFLSILKYTSAKQLGGE